MKKILSANLSKEFLGQLNLSTECPSSNSLFFQLWSLNAKKVTRHVEESLNPVVKNGDLSFTMYGKYLFMNEYYRYYMAHNFIVAAKKARERTLKALLQQLFITTKISRKSCIITWGIDFSKYDSTSQTHLYIKFLHKVATKFDPIYLLIPLMAREYLACWMSLQFGSLNDDNPYSGVLDNKQDTTSVYAIGNFLENYLHNHPNSLDTFTTRQLYLKTIDYEVQAIVKNLPAPKSEMNTFSNFR